MSRTHEDAWCLFILTYVIPLPTQNTLTYKRTHTHTHTYAHTHEQARTHARTHAHTHTHTMHVHLDF